MKIISRLVLVAFAATAPALSAQQPEASETEGARLSVNVFRAPSTGVDYRLTPHASVHAGFYPTVVSIEGEREGVGFIRVGATYWQRPMGSGFYASTGVALSLEPDAWGDSFANEVGYHQRLGANFAFRVGAIVLTTVKGFDSRLNPTIGLSFRPAARRLP